MRTLALLAAFPVALGGVLVLGGAAYADGSTCTTSSSGPVTTTCTSTSSGSGSTTPITESQSRDGTKPIDFTTLPAQYCQQQLLGVDSSGGVVSVTATGAQFQTNYLTTTTTTYKGRSTAANARNAKTTTTTTPTVVRPLVLTTPESSLVCGLAVG